ncbi:MAG: hypothetical protein KDA58_02715, partial [Planctomycetaceae bacterium]|nr:hypothetical protein [Planctomycetaceae bacterium]
HMPLQTSEDFGARDFASDGKLQIHDHLFPSANTGVTWLMDCPEGTAAHERLLQECMRVDLFGLKEDGAITGELHAPLRPVLPTLQPGKTYLLETVIRTLKMGHIFTQGTSDSNEVWLEVTVKSGDRVIGRSGHIDESGEVDRWSHFLNSFVLDENGNRINRRNAQDIRVPLYNHQMPPGAGQVVHYELPVPDDVDQPVTIEVKLQYRKFDQEFMAIIAQRHKPGDLPLRGHEPGKPYRNPLPIITMATDSITLPIAGGDAEPLTQQDRSIPLWQRWNDYGIGLFLEGKAELKQAEEAFQQVEELGRYDGPLNLARVYQREGRLDEAVRALQRAGDHADPPAPPWTLSWLTGVVNAQQGNLKTAEENFRAVLDMKVPERKFDFSRDYEVINELGLTLFRLAQQQRGEARKAARDELLTEAVEVFRKTLSLDSENVTAHYNLQLLYQQLGQTELADEHAKLHQRFKEDDTIRGEVIRKARAQYPAADHAAEALVIHSLTRDLESK